MILNSLEDLYKNELADLHSAETQVLKVLPRFMKTASSGNLRDAFERHEKETTQHVERLDQILNKLDKQPRKTCKAMEGLIEEANEIIKSTGDPMVIDAGLITHAQRLEHYEIAAYGCARTFAAVLGDDEAVELLQQSLDEEVAADRRLTALAESVVNPEAAVGAK